MIKALYHNFRTGKNLSIVILRLNHKNLPTLWRNYKYYEVIESFTILIFIICKDLKRHKEVSLNNYMDVTFYLWKSHLRFVQLQDIAITNLGENRSQHCHKCNIETKWHISCALEVLLADRKTSLKTSTLQMDLCIVNSATFWNIWVM